MKFFITFFNNSLKDENEKLTELIKLKYLSKPLIKLSYSIF